MRISEIEVLSGFNRDTIRYYERIGLLTSPPRKTNSYRVYTERHLRELLFIKKGRDIGFSLEEIKHGAKTFAKEGKLCKESVTQLKLKKIEILKRIEEDKNSIRKIEKLLAGILE
jgi:DNA-binding transcriptional MerR regulator